MFGLSQKHGGNSNQDLFPPQMDRVRFSLMYHAGMLVKIGARVTVP